MTDQAARNQRAATRRGAAIAAVVVLLLVLELIVLGMLVSGARDQTLMAERLDSVQAFYAAEGGMQMALREAYTRCDEDGDGAIGTISDNGTASDDPDIGDGQVVVTEVVSGGTTTRTSAGRTTSARCTIDAAFQ